MRFVNDLGLWILNPMGKGWLNALFPSQGVTPVRRARGRARRRRLRRACSSSARPACFDVAAGASGRRGLKEGDELVRALFELQRRSSRPIFLVPQVFVWTKLPDTRGAEPFDFILGPREWPNPTRTVAQFLYNYRHVELKLGGPLDLSPFLAGQKGQSRRGAGPPP